MRTWVTVAIAGGLLLAAGTDAGAGVLVLGQSLAAACSKAAVGGAQDSRALALCSRSLAEEALPRRDLAATHVNRGVIHFRRRDDAAALTDFEKALAIDPSLGEALVNRGSVRVRQGRLEEALVDLDRGLALGVKQPERAYFIRAVAREALDDTTGAYLDFRKAAELNPKWGPPREELARFTVAAQPR
ncbi:MAG TPA: tetratricopeptide repeat protein [Caulobacteraceae bacterium]|jgi:tetratricopeptide (TPR) repeat protein